MRSFQSSWQIKYQNFNLGSWVSSQRFKRDKLDLKRIQLLESLPQWSWNPIEDQWNEGFEYLTKYVEEYDHARVPNKFKYENYSLGTWVGGQRHTRDYLDLEKIKMLDPYHNGLGMSLKTSGMKDLNI